VKENQNTSAASWPSAQASLISALTETSHNTRTSWGPLHCVNKVFATLNYKPIHTLRKLPSTDRRRGVGETLRRGSALQSYCKHVICSTIFGVSKGHYTANSHNLRLRNTHEATPFASKLLFKENMKHCKGLIKKQERRNTPLGVAKDTLRLWKTAIQEGKTIAGHWTMAIHGAWQISILTLITIRSKCVTYGQLQTQV
jgi:hypothetical protein